MAVDATVELISFSYRGRRCRRPSHLPGGQIFGLMSVASSQTHHVDLPGVMSARNFALRCVSVSNLFFGLTAAVCQMVISLQGYDPLAQAGAGIWTGIILVVAGFTTWMTVRSKDTTRLAVALTWSVMAVAGSMAMITVSTIVIDNEPYYSLMERAEAPGRGGFFREVLERAFKVSIDREMGTLSGATRILNMCNKVFYNRCRDRMMMEAALFVCGVMSFILNVLAGVLQTMR